MRLLIIGHGRHGKDTVAEYLRDRHDFKFTSSSEFVGRACIWESWGKHLYPTFDAMYDDRANHRATWHKLIAEYNTPDKARTAREMLESGYGLYVGMRARAEFEVAKKLFNHVVWVDASHRLPNEPADSMQLNRWDAHFVVDNNSDLENLNFHCANLASYLKGGYQCPAPLPLY